MTVMTTARYICRWWQKECNICSTGRKPCIWYQFHLAHTKLSDGAVPWKRREWRRTACCLSVVERHLFYFIYFLRSVTKSVRCRHTRAVVCFYLYLFGCFFSRACSSVFVVRVLALFFFLIRCCYQLVFFTCAIGLHSATQSIPIRIYMFSQMC